MIWTLGFLAVLCSAIFYAGFKFDSLFMEPVKTYAGKETGATKFNGERAFGLGALTIVVALLWPVLVPAGLLFLLGKKLSK